VACLSWGPSSRTFPGKPDGVFSPGEAELAIDFREVRADHALAQMRVAAYLVVGEALGEELEYSALVSGEQVVGAQALGAPAGRKGQGGQRLHWAGVVRQK